MFTDENIINLSDDELNHQISELYKRLGMIAGNPMATQQLINQLYSLVDLYQAEQLRRMEKDEDTGVVLDTDKMPEKKQIESTTKGKSTKVIRPSNFNKVYKQKKENQ